MQAFVSANDTFKVYQLSLLFHIRPIIVPQLEINTLILGKEFADTPSL